MAVTRGYHNVTFRYTVAPTEMPPVSAFIPISATHEETMQEIEIGYRDALRVI